jgi:DNA-binding MarR family transcriptional regulator
MAALLARMERDGLISRKPHPTDKRATEVSLTATAKARVPVAKEEMFAIAERAVSGFSDRERATLLSLLQRVVQNLDVSEDA